ncbi:hypothetical protein V1264_010110 [Littorina saxatilis]|uniref:Uncharacterized protein n=1 Tax=Littorina saxatilis TaxID=31220 RepID=A0AAN9AP11_9CAEN
MCTISERDFTQNKWSCAPSQRGILQRISDHVHHLREGFNLDTSVVVHIIIYPTHNLDTSVVVHIITCTTHNLDTSVVVHIITCTTHNLDTSVVVHIITYPTYNLDTSSLTPHTTWTHL